MPKKPKPPSRSPADPPTPPSQPGGKVGERVSFTTLEQLTAAVAEPIECTFEMNGKVVSIPTHRLSTEQTDMIEAVRREVPTPPLIKGRTQLEDRYDTDNPEYRNKQIHANRLARSLTVYFGCPLFNKARPGLKDRNEILKFVENPASTEAGNGKTEEKAGEKSPNPDSGNGSPPSMTNVILEIIYLSIAGEAIKVREELNQRVNF